MFAIMGVTGQVGGELARTLLAKGQQVRAIVRSSEKGAPWQQRGCAIAVASTDSPESLQKAFEGADGVFAMLQPIFDPPPGFPEARAAVDSLYTALLAASPKKLVFLSTIGGQVERPSLLSQLHLMEEQIGKLPTPLCFLRAGWFMENSSWDVAPARDLGVIPSFLQPLDKPVPMVATEDVARTAAGSLLEDWQGRRVVQLEGPVRISPNDVAAAFSRVLGRAVHMEAVPRETWDTLFRSQGMKNPGPRIQMLDGFNEGWIEFEGGEGASRKGSTMIDAVVQKLVRCHSEIS